MKSKRMFTTRVKENMVVSEDVYTADEQLLIPEGTVLTTEIIEALKERSIFAVRIQMDEDGMTPVEGSADDISGNILPQPGISPGASVAEPEEGNYYQAVRETKEFQEFSETFLQTVDKFKDVFNRVVMQNEEIDSEEILEEVENVISKSRNSLHVLDMLQCMKGYDDVTYVHCMNVALLSNMIGKLVIPDISEEDLNILT